MNSFESLGSLTVPLGTTIQECLRNIDLNKRGIAFVVDTNERVVASVTDGDIRRRLIDGVTIEAAIETCMNRKFVSATQGADRANILKLLDHRIHTIPILDQLGRLVDIYSRDRFRLEEEREVFSRARAPARISFGGGGTDLTSHFAERPGAVINATIARYAHATLKRRSDSSIRLYSHDLRESVEAANIADLEFNGQLDLLKAVVRLINPDYGFELEVSADFPVGSGLGGSAVVTCAIIGCFNEFRSDRWNRHQIAEMAFQSERLMLNISGGWQDQYATVFGGVNFMEFSATENDIISLRVPHETLLELEENLVLVFTGATRNSGKIHEANNGLLSEEQRIRASDQLMATTLEMKRRLLRGQLAGFGELLHESWRAKQQFNPGASSGPFDDLYDFAMNNGAVGGKMLGAGGGGYFVFFVRPFQRMAFLEAMEEREHDCQRLFFDDKGLQSWRARVPE